MTLSGVLPILFVLYIYFVCASVTHVVARSEVLRETQALQAEINALEAKYIAVQHEVSARVATLDGYVPVTSKQFIDRSTPSLVLSD